MRPQNTAAVHRGPVPPEDAARAAGPPPAGPAAVRGRPAPGRYPGCRRQHFAAGRRRAAHRHPEGSVGSGLRRAAEAATAATMGRAGGAPVQEHQDVDDGTAGQT